MAFFCFAQGILVFLCCIIVLASASDTIPPPNYLDLLSRAHAAKPAYKFRNSTAAEILKAEKLVEDSIARQSLYNIHRVENPIKNSHVSQHSAHSKAFKQKATSALVRPTLNSTVLAAAKLLAERDAAAQHANGTLHRTYPKP